MGFLIESKPPISDRPPRSLLPPPPTHPRAASTRLPLSLSLSPGASATSVSLRQHPEDKMETTCQEEAGEPHGALFLVLGYLRLRELLSVHGVCRLLRDAIAGDVSLWRDVVVEPPLSGRLTDDILVEVTSRSRGRLRTLALVNCWKVTDAGLQRIVDDNPGIVRLHAPGCSYLTADGVVKAVKSTLVDGHGGSLKQLRLNGIPNITKEHLDILKSILKAQPQPFFYSDWCSQPPADNGKDDRPIDIDICPKCDSPRLVFDCTRENCRLMKDRGGECRGCIFCVPRCGECGGCVGFQELGEESACSHLLCLECWLRFPKCNMCNRPYCRKHKNSPAGCSSKLSGFVCEDCQRHEDLFSDLE